jgi:hypothetical protein
MDTVILSVKTRWNPFSFIIFAPMKWKISIVFSLVLVLLAACTPSKQASELVEGPNPELSAIDSLMWRQPDSALAVLQQFAASPKADSLDEYNGHYCQLLISELLYKNDYGQSNRPALQQAVRYFDSLCLCKGVVRNVSTIAFLDARAHYINGVGYYERDSVVEACKEYLKTLEVMEEKFEEKELTGKKAIFMTYTYNRLVELFSAQFMMDPAIACGQKALMFCRIEPTSPQGVSNILYRLGKQYDKMNEIDKARHYYGQALESMTNTDNLVYRDIVSSKALCDYKTKAGIEPSLSALRNMVTLANTENERLNRFLTIGGILFEERLYDSALYYLVSVFQNTTDEASKIRAAENLRIIYDSIGDREQSNAYMRFLSEHKKSEGENKALVSKLEDMFQNHKTKKQGKQAEEARAKSIRRTIEITVPIAVAIALSLLVVTKLRSWKLLRKQQEEADKKLGETKQEHEQEMKQWQAETEKTLKDKETSHQQEMEAKEVEARKVREQHEEELNKERERHRKEKEALENAIQESAVKMGQLEELLEEQKMNEAQKESAKTFVDEPVCQKIMEDVRYLRITTRDNHYQSKYAISDNAFRELGEAVERNYCGFDAKLLRYYKDMKQEDFLLCYLYLLDLNEKQIAVLRQCSYSAIKKQAERLGKRMGIESKLAEFVKKIAAKSDFTE